MINIRIAILGPVSSMGRGEDAEQFHNLRRMCETADEILELGFTPFVPGLYSIWSMIRPKSRDVWIEMCRQEIMRCDACYRMPGESAGADAEVEFANLIEIPVFTRLENLACWAKGHRATLAFILREGNRMLGEAKKK